MTAREMDRSSPRRHPVLIPRDRLSAVDHHGRTPVGTSASSQAACGAGPRSRPTRRTSILYSYQGIYLEYNVPINGDAKGCLVTNNAIWCPYYLFCGSYGAHCGIGDSANPGGGSLAVYGIIYSMSMNRVKTDVLIQRLVEHGILTPADFVPEDEMPPSWREAQRAMERAKTMTKETHRKLREAHDAKVAEVESAAARWTKPAAPDLIPPPPPPEPGPTMHPNPPTPPATARP
jgi:hypothetical protein